MNTPPFRELRVVCPVFNESPETLKLLIAEWALRLDSLSIGWEWVFIDSSTRLDSRRALMRLCAQDARMRALRLPGKKHGAACHYGYRSLFRRSRWILQIDSDGQCPSEDFPLLWLNRKEGRHSFGVRRKRKDGLVRKAVSQGVRRYLRWATGIDHPDPNSPYRLLYCPKLERPLKLPPFELANIALALRLRRDSTFQPVGFRPRRDGRSSQRVADSARALAEFLRTPVLSRKEQS